MSDFEEWVLVPFAKDFWGDEKAEDAREVLRTKARYLPRTGAAGEMVFSPGKVECFSW